MIIAFIAGMIVGGFVGVVGLAILVVSGDAEDRANGKG
jgi:hypothetical protein